MYAYREIEGGDISVLVARASQFFYPSFLQVLILINESPCSQMVITDHRHASISTWSVNRIALSGTAKPDCVKQRATKNAVFIASRAILVHFFAMINRTP